MSEKVRQEIKNIKIGNLPRIKKDKEFNHKLPNTNCNIPMPDIHPQFEYNYMGNKICDTCIKEDVCMYKSEVCKAVEDIKDISERVNVFINTNIECQKYSAKASKKRKI